MAPPPRVGGAIPGPATNVVRFRLFRMTMHPISAPTPNSTAMMMPATAPPESFESLELLLDPAGFDDGMGVGEEVGE